MKHYEKENLCLGMFDDVHVHCVCLLSGTHPCECLYHHRGLELLLVSVLMVRLVVCQYSWHGLK